MGIQGIVTMGKESKESTYCASIEHIYAEGYVIKNAGYQRYYVEMYINDKLQKIQVDYSVYANYKKGDNVCFDLSYGEVNGHTSDKPLLFVLYCFGILLLLYTTGVICISFVQFFIYDVELSKTCLIYNIKLI